MRSARAMLLAGAAACCACLAAAGPAEPQDGLQGDGLPQDGLPGDAMAGDGLPGDSGLTWGQAAGLLAAMGASASLGWTGCKKMQAIRLEPQPLEVKRSPDYVTKREFEAYKGEVRDSLKGVHARINTASVSLSEMRGKLDKIDHTQQEILNLLLHRHDERQ